MNRIGEKFRTVFQTLRVIGSGSGGTGTPLQPAAHGAKAAQSKIATGFKFGLKTVSMWAIAIWAILEAQRKEHSFEQSSKLEESSKKAWESTNKRVSGLPEVAFEGSSKKVLSLKFLITPALVLGLVTSFTLLAGDNKPIVVILGFEIKPALLMAFGSALTCLILAGAITYFFSHTFIRNAPGGGGALVRNHFGRIVNGALFIITLGATVALVFGLGEIREYILNLTAQANGNSGNGSSVLAMRIIVAGEIFVLTLLNLYMDPLPSHVLRKHRTAYDHAHRRTQRKRRQANRAWRRAVKRYGHAQVYANSASGRLAYVDFEFRKLAAMRGIEFSSEAEVSEEILDNLLKFEPEKFDLGKPPFKPSMNGDRGNTETL